jgi:hypothetical protein
MIRKQKSSLGYMLDQLFSYKEIHKNKLGLRWMFNDLTVGGNTPTISIQVLETIG